MVDHREIQGVCEQIVRAFKPHKIILFGSHASGVPTPDSDVDLLVIMAFEGSPIRKAAEVALQIEHRFPLDLLVRTPEHVAQRVAMNDFFVREIMEKGRVLYDADRVGVGAEG